jgi:hypothetical protein
MEKDNTLRDVNRQDIIMRPKCNSGTANDMHVMYSATGFLLPCCLCDSTKENHDEFALLGFFDEELKVENVDSFSDIVTSEVWNDFYDMFKDNPHGLGLPHECLKFCGVPYVHNLINDNPQRTG